MKGGKKGPAQISGEGKKGPAQEIPGERRRGQHRFQEKEKGASTDFRNSFLILC